MIPINADATKIYSEFTSEQNVNWFDLKRTKFLHNIDTFYYSVFLKGNFTKDSQNEKVFRMRNYFEQEFLKMDNFEVPELTLKNLDIDGRKGYSPKGLPTYFILKPFTFAKFYNVNIQRPECYDFFIARQVPNIDTAQVIVQIRSYYLWLHGVHKAYDKSLEDLKLILDYFGLEIKHVQENRVDYCWHTNYVQSPDRFFLIDNFAKMRVSRLHEATYHVRFRGNEEHEIDYVRLGNLRSNKVLTRFYLKSKEVVEQGYKGFFFKIWLVHGLINRYDLYVYEECYKRQSWEYLHKARLKFYLEYGSDKGLKHKCAAILDEVLELDYDDLVAFADLLTPRVTLIINTEYQTMRKFSKSIQLIPFKDNTSKGVSKYIYDYLDNRQLILDYLTHNVLRLTDIRQLDRNKSRRDYCPFWKALRRTKLIDTLKVKQNIKLTREYANRLNKEKVKERALTSVVTYQLYDKGVNDETIANDAIDFILSLNDNDMYKMRKYKLKKIRQLNSDQLDGLSRNYDTHFALLDKSTGEIID